MLARSILNQQREETSGRKKCSFTSSRKALLPDRGCDTVPSKPTVCGFIDAIMVLTEGTKATKLSAMTMPVNTGDA